MDLITLLQNTNTQTQGLLGGTLLLTIFGISYITQEDLPTSALTTTLTATVLYGIGLVNTTTLLAVIGLTLGALFLKRQ